MPGAATPAGEVEGVQPAAGATAAAVSAAPIFMYEEKQNLVSATAVPDTKDANSVHYIYVCQKGGTGDEG